MSIQNLKRYKKTVFLDSKYEQQLVGCRRSFGPLLLIRRCSSRFTSLFK